MLHRRHSSGPQTAGRTTKRNLRAIGAPRERTASHWPYYTLSSSVCELFPCRRAEDALGASIEQTESSRPYHTLSDLGSPDVCDQAGEWCSRGTFRADSKPRAVLLNSAVYTLGAPHEWTASHGPYYTLSTLSIGSLRAGELVASFERPVSGQQAKVRTARCCLR